MFHARRSARLLPALALVALSGCSASNRLDEVALSGRRVAVAAAIPPAPRVQAGSPLEAGVNPWDPVGTAVRRETSEAKRRQAVRAQTRLDSVVARVDVADRIARRTLARTARALGFTPAPRPAEADFVLDLRVADYGLVADSFEGDTFFILLGEAVFLDAATGAELWRTDLEEREVVDRTVFHLPAIAGNVVTGRALAALSSGEMAIGLQRLGDLAAERISDRLVRDYRRSRGRYARR